MIDTVPSRMSCSAKWITTPSDPKSEFHPAVCVIKAYLGLHAVKWSPYSVSGRRPPVQDLPLCRLASDAGSDKERSGHHPGFQG